MRRRRSDDGGIGAGEHHEQRRDRLGEAVLGGGTTGDEHLLDALQRGGGRRGAIGAMPEQQHVDRSAERFGGRQGAGRDVVEVAVLLFGDEQRGHDQITPTSVLSLSTSSATEPTRTPALRPVGSTVFSTARRGLGSTP